MSGSSSPTTAEYLRRLAVAGVLEGETPEEVADLLDVSERSVWRWLAAFRREGPAGLALHPGRGRPPKLTPRQVERVLGWLDQDPAGFGFATDRWTAPRVAWLIQHHFHLTMNPQYLNEWLRRHGVTPQIPQRQARERDDKLIAGWIAHQWPRVKKS